MTMGIERPQHSDQAVKLLETGNCDLPVGWAELADVVRRHPIYTYALKALYQRGDTRTLKLITEVCALSLCRDFMPEEDSKNES